ncbi:MAG TPA: DUF1949 domain-containing protein, partial [Rhodanobacteraceae bacterium]|nr:DUF1949 domain-containing protein [Rhodanobacteraceae bacterium]
DFATLALIQSRLAGFEASAGVPRFDADGAHMTLTLPSHRLDGLREWLRDATRGRGTLRELSSER